MVKVSVDQDKDSRIKQIRITGHANAAPHGEDLVCAGVSSIAIGALNAIDLLEKKSCLFEMKHGHIELRVVRDSDQLQLLLSMLLIQLTTLEESYKKYIRIRKQEV